VAIQAGGIELGLALNTASFNKSIKTANNSVKNFVNGVSSAGSSVSGLSKGLTGVGVAAGATGYALIRMSKAAFQVAADVAEMNVAMEAVGKSTGIGGAAIKGAAKDIRKMGIEMKASQEIALLFVKGKMDLAKADDLARVAQDLAVISQSNSTETAQTLTYAIQNGNSQLLKSAGITKYASEAYASYARELKISHAAPENLILYTDGSSDPSRTPIHAVGAVLLVPALSLVLHTMCQVPIDVVASWLPSGQHIHLVELFACRLP